MFGASLPALNIAGEGKVRTKCGGLASLLIFYMTFLFGIHKLQVMLERRRPFIVTNIDSKAFNDGTEITTAEPQFALAVGAKNFLTGVKDDSRYFKWVAV